MIAARQTRTATGWICDSCRSSLQSRATNTIKSHQQVRQSSNNTTRGKLPHSPARTRFAPSPTGNLHLGSIRTALFNYLLAKRTKGQFLLRLEDTDQKRTVPGAEERLYKDLQWAGLQWDEGPVIGGPYGPYRQSERTPIYQKHIEPLLKQGKAYRCFCSSERLDELNRRRHEKGLNLGYDRKCIDIHLDEAEERAHRGEAHVIRFRAPQEWPKYNDLVYGKTGHGSEKLKKLLVDEPVYEDVILIKSDGFPTYHWANICDDHDMKITHVVRGSEWMSSTPLHVALYQAFDWTPPLYAHVPLLVDVNGQKLSKRNFDSDIASFRNTGMFPEALVNFAALLGWSHLQKTDVMDLEQLENAFDLKITKGNTIVSFDKLRYLQEHHARRRVQTGGEEFEQMIRDVAVTLLEKYGAGTITSFIGKRQLRDVVASLLQSESLAYRSVSEFVAQSSIFLDWDGKRSPLEISDSAQAKQLRIAAATLCLVPEANWKRDVHRMNLRDLQTPLSSPNTDAGVNSEETKKWKKDLYHYLRWALLGGRTGPAIPDTMEILGRDICVQRIQDAAMEIRDEQNMKTKPELLKASSFQK